LASEKIRWSDSVMRFREQAKMLPGDVLLVNKTVCICISDSVTSMNIKTTHFQEFKNIAKNVKSILGKHSKADWNKRPQRLGI
jgi:hypothetical protein